LAQDYLELAEGKLAALRGAATPWEREAAERLVKETQAGLACVADLARETAIVSAVFVDARDLESLARANR
jgi:hypothetical protein